MTTARQTDGDEELIEAMAEALAVVGGERWEGVFENERAVFCDLARAALAVVREREGWRTIESAPKDGTEILLAGHCTCPSVDAGDPTVVKSYWTDHNGGGWVWFGAASDFTYWRPLPPAPEGA